MKKLILMLSGHCFQYFMNKIMQECDIIFKRRYDFRNTYHHRFLKRVIQEFHHKFLNLFRRQKF
jgi:hypothetical protein